MTTEQKFNCIFCKDVFDNKEELQVHFRKHADPKFKSKSRFGNDTEVADDKVKDSETVSCDVCSRMFPTISKAITHKHKVHPDHDVKYFCPWCGKLFTMKHPYNVHVQTTHDKQEQIENKYFHCDSCDVDFFLPSAMIYHNKFFHRQDTDIPDVGLSKKLRLYNQEVLQLHYCAFCGEEYENKVNLFKHITDDHSDENQSPEEVLRCPLCEAIFYHLDAYEIHLSFHTTEDLYSAQNELFADLLDFSLETVPPVIEKVENREEFETEALSQDTDADSTVNAMGIENFLELAMGQPDDSNSGKVKKKKHKKSKKSAITLDEFLSMNQDVFGEGLDFQGAEEVPTRVVAKQLKNKKKVSNVMASVELEKLKQKGIVVVKVGSSKPPKLAQKKVTNKTTQNRELKTSSEVLTKLINQSNNQIQVVKKMLPNVTPKQIEQDTENTVDDQNSADQNKNEEEMDKTYERVKGTEQKSDDVSTFKDHNLPLDTSENLSPTEVDDCPSSTSPKITSDTNENIRVLSEEKNSDTKCNSTSDNAINSGHKNKTIVNDLPNAGKTNDSLEAVCSSTIEQGDQPSDQEFDSKVTERDNLTDAEDNESGNEPNNEKQESTDKNSTQSIRQAVNSLSTLKHLSHLTVKPVNQTKNTLPDLTADNASENKSNGQAKPNKEPPRTVIPTENEMTQAKLKSGVDKDPAFDALKTLSKNITIKSLTTPSKRTIAESESGNNGETNETIHNSTNNIKLRDVGGNKNLTVKKIKIETDCPLTNKEVKTVSNVVKNMQASKSLTLNKINTLPPEVKSNDPIVEPAQNSPIKMNTNILKHFPNISTKSLLLNKKLINIPNKEIVETNQKEQEIIEISDIDDSDTETDNNIVPTEPKQETSKTIDPLKNLSKHITVKSLNQTVVPTQPILKNIKVEKMDEAQNDNDEHNHVSHSDEDVPSNLKACSQKMSSRNVAFKNALKNLGKNITVKSRTSSPCQSIKSQDHNSKDSYKDENETDVESDSDIGKVKITELKNDEANDDGHFEDSGEEEYTGNNPIIESPHDSCSEHEESDNKLLDFESEIDAAAMQQTNREIATNKNTICLNNLKNISKSLTIKSLNSNAENQEKPKPTHENVEPTKHLAKQFNMKPPKQPIKQMAEESTTVNRNIKNTGKIVDHSSKESVNQKVSVNKEVTVKTFQTKTVIQEITTTVTKTIKTVNQMVKQETRNTSQMNIPVMPQKVQGMKPSTSRNLQGVVIRQAGSTPVRPSNVVAQIRPANTAVRPSKQIVPMRPGLKTTRPSAPRMPSAKTNSPKSSPNKHVIGKPLKFSPAALSSALVKRPTSEEVSGPFSCFKKPKESLIPVSDVPVFAAGGDGAVQMKASHTSSSNYMTASKVVKGNSVVTATQMKSEVTSTQQFSRLNNAVGVKVRGTQVKQTQVQEKSESTSMKRTTLEAIERLQKQGLLVKKPRVEADENSNSEFADDNVGYSSTEEHGE